jgi:hypothetical protein
VSNVEQHHQIAGFMRAREEQLGGERAFGRERPFLLTALLPPVALFGNEATEHENLRRQKFRQPPQGEMGLRPAHNIRVQIN